MLRSWVVGAAVVMGQRPVAAAEALGVVSEPSLPPEVEMLGEVTVEVASDVFEAETLRAWVQERSLATVEARAPLRAGDRIVIAVEGMPLDYAIEVSALRWGKALPGGPPRVECACTADELLATVERLVEQAVSELELRDRVERKQMEQQRLAQERAQQAEHKRRRRRGPGEAQDREPYRPAALGLAGAIGTGLGGAMFVTGVALIARGDGPPTDNDLIVRTNLRPPGVVVLGVGATVLATGVALLVVDAVRCRKDRARCGQRRAAVERARRSIRRGITWR
ncbi:MAG: hypothetical protein AAGF11_38860 [Myxococcota bacterium]